ncbi:hypothetical protein OROHE_007483 [Orobanche hederae]
MERGREKELSSDVMNKVVQFVLEGSVAGKPMRGRLGEVARQISIHRQTVWSLISNCSKYIECSKRGTQESLAFALKVSIGTFSRWIRSGQIRGHNSAIKPDLTMANKLLRMRFSFEQMELDMILNKLRFKDMHNTIHIDEKWFYITRGRRRFYLAPDEEEPHKSCKNKKFICKIMFMCAVGRPLFGPTGEIQFDGKIGIFPFTMKEAAKKRSKNRLAGILITKPIESINKMVIKDCLINKP